MCQPRCPHQTGIAAQRQKQLSTTRMRRWASRFRRSRRRQESLFLTLGGRALDSRLPRPFLGDTLPDEILTRVGYDLASSPH